MTSPTTPIKLDFLPGIQRDGTQLDSKSCVDGLWVRWQRGRPRKMLGYYESIPGWTGPVRGMDITTINSQAIIHAGNSSGLERGVLAADGTAASGVTDRSPAGFTANAAILWQFDFMYDSGSADSKLIAHPGQNLFSIDNDQRSPIYYGPTEGTSAFVTISGAPSVCGGIVVLHPYLMAFCGNGYVQWSDTNLPGTWSGGASGSARICEDKIVYGKQVRGGPTNAPTGLLWTVSNLIRVSFAGTATTTFKFDTISDHISILSSQGVVEYDGNFYWPGTDRFLCYTGTVKEVPNSQNLNWFFDNLNWTYRQKVFAMKRPRWGEIWWCFPFGAATECTHAVVLNVREQTWYDTRLPDGGRTAGHFGQSFRYPVMFGNDPDDVDKYALWTEEYNLDRVTNAGVITAIESYYETPNLTLLTGDLGIKKDAWVRLTRLEPDYIQAGDLRLDVKGRKWPQPSETEDPAVVSFTFSPNDNRVDMKEQRRFMRLRVTSNGLAGNYQQGSTLLHIGEGDGRQ